MSDYPTNAELRTICNWTGTFKGLWEYVVELWHWPDWGVKVEVGETFDKLELHTGGWSGNESIMYALERSKSMFYQYFATEWHRGGHYFFEVQHDLWDWAPKAKEADAVS